MIHKNLQTSRYTVNEIKKILSCFKTFFNPKECYIKTSKKFPGWLCLSKNTWQTLQKLKKTTKEIMILFHTQFSEFFRALLFSRILAIPSCFRITAMCRGVFPSCPIKSRTFIGTLSLLICYLINILGV